MHSCPRQKLYVENERQLTTSLSSLPQHFNKGVTSASVWVVREAMDVSRQNLGVRRTSRGGEAGLENERASGTVWMSKWRSLDQSSIHDFFINARILINHFLPRPHYASWIHIPYSFD